MLNWAGKINHISKSIYLSIRSGYDNGPLFPLGDEELYEQTKNKQDRYDRKSKMITMAQSNANGVSVTVSFGSCFLNIFFSSFSLGKIKGHLTDAP